MDIGEDAPGADARTVKLILVFLTGPLFSNPGQIFGHYRSHQSLSYFEIGVLITNHNRAARGDAPEIGIIMYSCFKNSQDLEVAFFGAVRRIPVFALDREYRYTAFNEEFRRSTLLELGVTISLGDSFLDLVSNEEDRLRARRSLDRATSGEQITGLERFIVSQDRFRPNKVFCSRTVNNRGNAIGLFLFVLETVHHKTFQIQRPSYSTCLESPFEEQPCHFPHPQEGLLRMHSLDRLGAIAVGVVHDFNNLLSIIQGGADLAARSLDTETIRRHLNVVAEAVSEAKSLTRQVLDYSCDISTRQKAVDLNECIISMKDLFRAAVRNAVHIAYSLETGLPPIDADKSQLFQIVLNLITNGAESMGGRAGVLRIATGASRLRKDEIGGAVFPSDLEDGDYVTLTVADNGSGMSKDVLERVFDPFFSTKCSGRGLGLTSVLRIAVAHKGGIRVETALEEGTCIQVLFPLMDSGTATDRDDCSSDGRNEAHQPNHLVSGDGARHDVSLSRMDAERSYGPAKK